MKGRYHVKRGEKKRIWKRVEKSKGKLNKRKLLREEMKKGKETRREFRSVKES